MNLVIYLFAGQCNEHTIFIILNILDHFQAFAFSAINLFVLLLLLVLLASIFGAIKKNYTQPALKKYHIHTNLTNVVFENLMMAKNNKMHNICMRLEVFGHIAW